MEANVGPSEPKFNSVTLQRPYWRLHKSRFEGTSDLLV